MTFVSLIKNYPLVYKVFILYSLAGLVLLFFIPFDRNILFQIVFPRLSLIIFPLGLNLSMFRKIPLDFRNGVIQLFPILVLSFFYNETALYNSFFSKNLDSHFYNIDQWIFGFQPALEFSKYFNGLIFSELMCFSYMSYYLIIFFTPLILLRKSFELFEYSVFIIIVSFIFYYLIFSFLPVIGPQFYFPTPLNEFHSSGIFGYLLSIIHHYGEVPSAAFPSSHVGIAVIVLILLFKYQKKYFMLFLPLTLMLSLATVYIKAHYFIDVIGGLISAPIIFYIVDILYFKLNKGRKYEFGNKRS